MKSIFFITAFLLGITPTLYTQKVMANTGSSCPAGDCECIRVRALSAMLARQHERAINKLQAWRTCDPAAAAEADSLTLAVFHAIEREKLIALANDLAYRAQIALRDGYRTEAFRLAEIVHLFIQPYHPDALGVLLEAYYYNNDPDTTHRLPWNATLQGHTYGVRSVAFSPDGAKIATASMDKTAIVWDVTTGRPKPIAVLKGHKSGLKDITFSPDGIKIATASLDNSAIIWEAATGIPIHTLRDHTEPVRSVVFSPDGTLLATASDDGSSKIWNVATAQLVRTLYGHDGKVRSVAFSPDGSIIASAGYDSTAVIWNLADGRRLSSLTEQIGKVRDMAFSPNGKILATASLNNNAKLWDAVTYKPIATLSGHTNAVRNVTFSPDGSRIITGSDDNTAIVWDVATAKPLTTFEGHSGEVRGIAISPKGERIATASYDYTAKIWDYSIPDNIVTLRQHTDAVRCSAISPDGTQIVTVSDDKTTIIWNTSGKIIRTFSGHTSQIRYVAFSPDGKWMATASDDKTVKIWDAATSALVKTLTGHSSAVRCVNFSPNGTQLVSSSDDNSAIIWNIASAQALTTLNHSGSIWNVAFSPDGTKIATASDDESAKIWNTANGQLIATLKGHIKRVRTLAFAPDGTQIATGSDDKTIIIWNIGTAKPVANLESHSADVRGVAFSPDGAKLVSASNDMTIKIWNTSTARLIATLTSHTADVRHIVFSPDGKKVITSSEDNTAKIWDVDPDSLIIKLHRERQVSPLLLPQIKIYELEPLLNLLPNGEQQLFKNNEIWQITAFADLYAELSSRSDNPSISTPYYERAARLYHYALENSGKQPLIALKLARMCQEWGYKYLVSGKVDSSLVLTALADQLQPADITIRKQVALAQLANNQFSAAMTNCLEMVANFQTSVSDILNDMLKLSATGVRLPEAESAIRLLRYDLLDNNQAKQLGILPPPYTTSEIDLLKRLPDSTVLLYCNLKLLNALTIYKFASKITQFEQIVSYCDQYARKSSGTSFSKTRTEALMNSALVWYNWAGQKDSSNVIREKRLQTALNLLDNVLNAADRLSSENDRVTIRIRALEAVALVHKRLADILFEQKEYSRAIDEEKVSLETIDQIKSSPSMNEFFVKTNSLSSWISLSRYYLFNRQPEEALRSAEYAYRLDTSSALTRENLINALLCNMRASEARRHLLPLVIENSSIYYINQLITALGHLDTICPGATAETRAFLQQGELSLLSEGVRVGIPRASEKLRFRKIEIARNKTIKLGSTVSKATDYRVKFDSSIAYIAACRDLLSLDSTETNRQKLGSALANSSFYACFTATPEKAIAYAQEAFFMMQKNWMRTNLAHGYLLSGDWEKAKAEYIAIKDLPDDSLAGELNALSGSLWADFQALAKAGIRHKNLAAAAELVLGRALTGEEKVLLEGK